jgi:XTP/dITP diphosphohydrolase
VIGMKEEFGESIDVEEPGNTLEGNAIIKAMTIGKRSGKLTLADDTGLEVDALDGEPGVKTARYVEGTDEDRYNFLLSKMKDIPQEKRGAQFHAVIVVYDPERSEKISIVDGICRGKIMTEAKPGEGFGYDPVFWIDEEEKMMSELASGQRGKTHRGKELAKAKEILLKEFV